MPCQVASIERGSVLRSKMELRSGESWNGSFSFLILMTMVTPRMPVHPHLRFGIGAMLIRAITPRYLSARFRGDKLFSSPRSRTLALRFV